jgi:membrane protease YdiL (CAAX protease family)
MSEQEQSGPASEQRPTTSPEFAMATQPSYAQTLFLDAKGLRPGWGLAFYIIALLFLQKLAVDLAWARDLGSSGLWSMMLEEFGNFIAAALPAIVLARVERRPWETYGLPLNARFGKLFVAGTAWGFAGISVLMLALYGAHAFHFGHIVLHGARGARFAVFWAVMFLLVGWFEEFLFRGYTLFTLARGIRFWPAAIVLSAAFGLIHLRNGGEQWEGALAAAAIGFFFCFTLLRTGNLWFAVGFHAAWDWGETFFYSVPDSGTVFPGHLLSSSLRGPAWLSGGSAGPEGSVLCFAVIALAWIALDRVYPNHDARPAALPATESSSSLASSE